MCPLLVICDDISYACSLALKDIYTMYESPKSLRLINFTAIYLAC